MPETTGRKQVRDERGRWRGGESGNPHGRPRGSRNRATKIAAELLDEQAEAITQRAIDAALEGDPVALRLCLERLLPPRRERPVVVEIGAVESVAQARIAYERVIAAAAAGELLPSEARSMATLLSDYGEVVERAEFEDRIAALEQAVRDSDESQTGER